MKKEIQQLSIFLENRVGRLAEVTRVLGEAGIDILAISVADTADFGILRLIVDDVEKASGALKTHGTVCTVNPVSVVPVAGVPGGLAKVLQVIHDSGLNVEYMYAVSQRAIQDPVMVFRFPHPEEAEKAFADAGIEQLTLNELLGR